METFILEISSGSGTTVRREQRARVDALGPTQPRVVFRVAFPTPAFTAWLAGVVIGGAVVQFLMRAGISRRRESGGGVTVNAGTGTVIKNGLQDPPPQLVLLLLLLPRLALRMLLVVTLALTAQAAGRRRPRRGQERDMPFCKQP